MSRGYDGGFSWSQFLIARNGMRSWFDRVWKRISFWSIVRRLVTACYRKYDYYWSKKWSFISSFSLRNDPDDSRLGICIRYLWSSRGSDFLSSNWLVDVIPCKFGADFLASGGTSISCRSCVSCPNECRELYSSTINSSHLLQLCWNIVNYVCLLGRVLRA